MVKVMAMKRLLIIFALWISGLVLGSSEIGFVFFGDAGTGSKDQYRVAQSIQKFCEHSQCDFVTLLGDNFYPSGVTGTQDPLWKKAFEIPYSALEIPFYAILGNHDYQGNIEAQIRYSQKSKQWRMPRAYYSLTRGPVDFFFLDTNEFDQKQKKWLKEGLAKSQSPWKIVCGHHPIYSYGDHGNSEELQEDLLPVIEGKVDFYLSGHDHNKQVIQKKSSDITFIVSGAGAKTDPLKRSRGALYTSEELGFSHFLISDKKAVLTILDKWGNSDYSTDF